jgi:hypothetical protein
MVPVYGHLANALGGPEYQPAWPAEKRAAEACRNRSVLIIFEGGEEADVGDPNANPDERRIRWTDLRSALAPQNRWPLLTRNKNQALPAEPIDLKEQLSPDDAGRLFDSLAEGRISGPVRDRVLRLLDGHPLAITWAGSLLARGDDEPERLAQDWAAQKLPARSEPVVAEHTLQWLFERSVRGLDDLARHALAAAGLLARALFPIAAIDAALEAPARESIKRLVQHNLLRLPAEDNHREFTHVLGYRFARSETASDPLLRARLAVWLCSQLAAELRATNHPSQSLSDLLHHAAALLRADHDHQL